MASKPVQRSTPPVKSAATNVKSKSQRRESNGDSALPVDGDKLPDDVPPPISTGDLRIALTRKTPTSKFLDVVRMERLYDKLVLLDYSTALAESDKTMKLSRHYFLGDGFGSGVARFHAFAGLSVWMIGELGIDLPPPKERDDPNATVAVLVDAIKKLDIQVQTSAHRLKSGGGSDVIAFLYELATACLNKQAMFQSPAFPQASSSPILDEDEEENTEEDDFQVIPFFDWDQEEVAEDINDGDAGTDDFSRGDGDLAAKERAAEEWRLEADRIAPFFNGSGGGSDRLAWSDRIKKLELCRKELDQSVDGVTGKLSSLVAEIARFTEKIQNREKYININHKDKVERYRVASAKLATAKSRYEAYNSEVEANAQKLAEVTAEFEKLKRRVEDKGNNAGDRVAITNMRAAMKRMKEEMGTYNIKCALAEHKLHALNEMLQNAEIQESLTRIETAGILLAARE